jgi:hypothetical protein
MCALLCAPVPSDHSLTPFLAHVSASAQVQEALAIARSSTAALSHAFQRYANRHSSFESPVTPIVFYGHTRHRPAFGALRRRSAAL